VTEHFYVMRDRATGVFVAEDEASLVPFDLAGHFVIPDDFTFTASAEALPQARLHWVGPCDGTEGG
jgi:hypothetical protein